LVTYPIASQNDKGVLVCELSFSGVRVANHKLLHGMIAKRTSDGQNTYLALINNDALQYTKKWIPKPRLTINAIIHHKTT
jgi:hypothetical protein